MFASLTLKARLVLVALIAAVAAFALGGFNAYASHRNTQALAKLYEVNVRGLVELQKLDTQLREVRFRVAGVLLDVMPVPGSLNHVRDTRKSVDASWTAFHATAATSDSDEQRALVRELAAGQAKVGEVLGKIERAYEAKDKNALTDVLESDWAALHKAFVKPLQQIIPMKEDSAKAVFEETKASNAQSAWLAMLLAAAVVVLVPALLWWVGRSLLGPMESLNRVLHRVAAGDLTAELPAARRDEFGRLAAGVGEMQVALRRLVGNVQASVQAVRGASGEIAQGNLQLSQRTEQQASNLQETAAAMEEMTASVKSNAENARLANQLAASASEVAARGGALVHRVVGTMGEIQTSSRKIADIIGTIDGIAFQTNILALNAAVEAARAGEQGRGFAVVASEVRSLAQRSAQAAREIKSLIGASVDKVEAGHTLVGEAGQTMNEIVTQVRRVSDLVGEITSASSEQSEGVSQVGVAISGLDQMTQQNAALVEESAAAAESLRGQAETLARLVAEFQLETTAKR
jgi:methyl-accepting chemotaxis protein